MASESFSSLSCDADKEANVVSIWNGIDGAVEDDGVNAGTDMEMWNKLGNVGDQGLIEYSIGCRLALFTRSSSVLYGRGDWAFCACNFENSILLSEQLQRSRLVAMNERPCARRTYNG